MVLLSMASRCLALAANAREWRARHTRARAFPAPAPSAPRAPPSASARLAIYRHRALRRRHARAVEPGRERAFYQIRALIRPWRLTGVLEALEAHGIRGLTTYDAQGAGVQSGSVERYQGATFDDTTHALVAKTVLEVVLAREQAQDVVDIIINAAQTGEIGDGKIFLMPVADVVRIRTGRRARTRSA